MRSWVVWSTWVYAALVVLGVLWGIVDPWAASDAMSSALVGGGCMALATTAMAPRNPFGWAVPMFVFASVALGMYRVGSRLAELEEPGSTLGGSGLDAVLLLLIVAWPAGFVLTIIAILSKPAEVVEPDRSTRPF